MMTITGLLLRILTVSYDHNLHDRQIERASWWKEFMPLVGVVVGGVITILGAWLINNF